MPAGLIKTRVNRQRRWIRRSRLNSPTNSAGNTGKAKRTRGIVVCQAGRLLLLFSERRNGDDRPSRHTGLKTSTNQVSIAATLSCKAASEQRMRNFLRLLLVSNASNPACVPPAQATPKAPRIGAGGRRHRPGRRLRNQQGHPNQAPTYEEGGVIHYCVANMPGCVAQVSTFAPPTPPCPTQSS